MWKIDLGLFAWVNGGRERYSCHRKSANSKRVGPVIRAVVTRIVHLDDISTSFSECVLEPTIEKQSDIVVTVCDESTVGIEDGDYGIKCLAEPASHDFKRDTLVPFDIK